MKMPGKLSAYIRLMRLDRPVGIWLLLWPCWWAITLAAPDFRTMIYWLAIFAVGAVIMRSAGCIMNDLVDRDIDRKVGRTRYRPLASGELSPAHAIILLWLLLLSGLALLLLFNLPSMVLGIISLPLLITYPFMKRLTWWPQLFLGLIFNWGALMGYTAVLGYVPPSGFAVYLACVLWTLGYDTIYAHQDKKDDAQIGVKSTALKLGDKTKPWLAGFYGGMILLLILAGMMMEIRWPYYLGVTLTALHLAWQIRKLDLDTPSSALAMFKSNVRLGWLPFLGALLTRVV